VSQAIWDAKVLSTMCWRERDPDRPTGMLTPDRFAYTVDPAAAFRPSVLIFAGLQKIQSLSAKRRFSWRDMLQPNAATR
jgi:hypothetical protein